MKLSQKILFLTLMAIGVVGFTVWDGFVIAAAVGDGVKIWKIVLCSVGGIVLSLLVGIVLHELGHLIFGLIGGMKFRAISLPFVKISRVNGRLKLSFFLNSKFFGMCEMYPFDGSKATKAFAFMAAGGPIGSFAALGVSVLFLALVPVVGYYASIILGIASPVLFAVFFENTFPLTANGAKTDGAQLIDMVNKTPSAQVLAAVLTVQALYAEGLSPAECPKELLADLPQLQEDDPSYLFLLNARYLCALDGGDVHALRDADMRIRDILPYIPDVYAEQLSCDMFYDSLFVCPDNAFVKANTDAVFKLLEKEERITAARIRGYYYLRSGKLDSALAEIEIGRSNAFKHPLGGIAKMELKLLDELESLVGKAQLEA